MKKVLIISPHFPPINAADMHRVRQNLPYFKEFGWQPTILAVTPKYIETSSDLLLLKTIPSYIEVIHVKAFSQKITRKFGVGSLSLRSLYFFYKEGTKLLNKRKFDLIFFSTTAFHVLILGRYWKKRFKIPYIIDMQDPWRNDYYLDKPRNKRPPKFFWAYRLNKYLERYTMKKVDGIIAVSKGYCDILQKRYRNIKVSDCLVLPFGAATSDFDILENEQINNSIFIQNNHVINIVYVGRGGHDLAFALEIFFSTIKKGLSLNQNLFKKIKIYFVGTSYAQKGKGTETVSPIAKKYGLEKIVTEITDRVPYFEALKILKESDLLFVPGSTDENYTASKIYPYILSKKPLVTIFNYKSSVVELVKSTNSGVVTVFSKASNIEKLSIELYEKINEILQRIPFTPNTKWIEFEDYTAKSMTKKQVAFFETILSK